LTKLTKLTELYKETRTLVARLHAVESPNVTYVSEDGTWPIFWERGEGCAIWDTGGREYLDLTAAFGVMGVGHGNPRVAEAIAAQAQKLVHGMGDVHPTRLKVELLEKLAAMVPLPDAQTILGCSGGDAIEAALKTARVYTKKPGVLAFTGGYHGLNLGALAVTYRRDFREPFAGQIAPFATHAPYGEPLESSLPEDVGAVLVEPIQGRGGIVVPPANWLRHLRQRCDEVGALLIFDEIFTGWGRTGHWFAGQHEGVTPDVLCVGKALGGGFPISACVARKEIMAAWGVSTGEALHTQTFLGSPLGCAAALSSLKELERIDAPGQAITQGARLWAGLEKLQSRYPEVISEVRGRGLMLGLKFFESARCLSVVDKLLSLGIIVLPAGAGDVLELTPPLVITDSEIGRALATLDTALQ
jgi:4-aminobutyrate aminotransferase / (S)-3-amino-2-methylpropionate transaminase / 5-aminovalerate transaminase